MFIQLNINFLAPTNPVFGLIKNFSILFGFVAGLVAGLIPSPIASLVAGFSLHLKPVTPFIKNDITRQFFLKKIIMTSNNSNICIYNKKTIWDDSLFFDKVNDIWQYMLSIFDPVQRSEIVKDIIHQYIFLAKKIGSEY